MAKTLEFYDVKQKKKVKKSDYRIVPKIVKGKKRKFAVARSKAGYEMWRVLPSDFKK
jgi:hypothetical protein